MPFKAASSNLIHFLDGAQSLGANKATTDNQILAWDSATSTWTPQTLSGAGAAAALTVASTYTTAGGTQTVGANTWSPFNCSGGVLTLNLPASPTAGDICCFVEVGGSVTTLTVGRNGNNIDGAELDATSAVAYRAFSFVYLGAFGWKTF